MKLKYKTIKRKDLNHFLTDNNCKLLEGKDNDYVNYYECDNNSLIVENTKANQIALYFDRDQYFVSKKEIAIKGQFNPLKAKQREILDLPMSKMELIHELSDSLNVSLSGTMSSEDLKIISRAIKKYGYAKAIENLYVNIIVFAGECIKATKGGNWIVRKSRQYPDDYEPVFVDDAGKDYSFWLNHSILKDFNTKNRFNLKQLVEFALVSDIFKD